jgi:hypothetical protein
MVYLVFDEDGKFVAAHRNQQKAEAIEADEVGGVGEVIPFEKATVYSDRGEA